MIKQLFLILSFSSLLLPAQEKYEYVTSDAHFSKGYDHFLKEEYTAAIHFFDKIHRSDTNFYVAQYNTIVAHYHDKKYDKANRTALAAIQDQNQLLTDVYYWYIESLIAQSDFEKARKVIKEAQNQFPLFYSYQYLLGKIYLQEKNKDAAEKQFIKVIKSHPQHSESHYQLAHLKAKNGNITEAILGLQFAIIVDRSSSFLRESFMEMEDLMQNNYEFESKPSGTNEFKTLDQIITSQAALKDNYKTNLRLNYIVVKQTDLLFKQLNFDQNSNNFSMQLYVDFMQQVKAKKLESAYTLYVISVLNLADINNEIKKHKIQIREFYELLLDFNLKFQNLSKYPINGITYDGDYQNGSNGILDGIGTKTNYLPTGDWTYFYNTGKILSTISYNEKGQKNGEAKWYDEKGNIIQYGTYKNSALEGEAYFSHDNNCKWYTANFEENEIVGQLSLFDNQGMLSQTKTIKNNLAEGEWKKYSYSGLVNEKGNFKKGISNGPYSTYFQNGNIYLKSTLKDGNFDGKYTIYHINGKVRKEGYFENGDRTKSWKEYSSQGNLLAQYAYKNGLLDGIKYQFSELGDTISVTPYKKGFMHGVEYVYNYKNQLLWKHRYKKNKLKYFENFDSLGAITHEGKSKYFINDGFGFKYKTGNVKKGDLYGLSYLFWKNGSIQKEKNFKDGLLTGDFKEYYSSGELKIQSQYDEGKLNGKYEEFHRSGKTSILGHFQNDEKIGAWKSFFKNGKLSHEEFYSNGEIDGYSTSFTIEGIKKYESLYRDGLLLRIDVFNAKGEVIQRQEFSQGNGKNELKHPTGYTYNEGEFKKGEWNGKVLTFFPNGKVMEQENYIHGILHGDQFSYYINGKIKEEVNYQYGYKQGLKTSYHENGTKSMVVNYLNNSPIDTVFKYYEDGQLKCHSILDFKGDVIKEIYYHENGNIEAITPYYRGFIHGARKTFDPEGNLVLIRKYNAEILYAYTYLKDGALLPDIPFNGTGEIKAFYNNGKPSCIYTLSDHVYEGKYIRYFSTGGTWISTNYKGDEIHGKYIVSYPNENIEYQYNYLHGTLNGTAQRYFKNGVLKVEENYIFGIQNGIGKYFNKEGQLIQTVTYNDNDIIDIK